MTGPAWMRYAHEPEALQAIILLHYREIERDAANADWYRQDIAEIEAHLRRLAAA